MDITEIIIELVAKNEMKMRNLEKEITDLRQSIEQLQSRNNLANFPLNLN